MGKKNYLERGFKAKAERISNKLRSELGLKIHEPLCAFELAEHLNIDVVDPISLDINGNQLKVLLGTSSKSSGWSALTMVDKKNRKLILHNTKSSPARQQSDIMHELAHIICKHKVVELKGIPLPSFMRYYDKSQEAEAECLGSCLQLSRECLHWALTKGNMTENEIAENFLASYQMVKFRIGSTGLRKQLQYLRN